MKVKKIIIICMILLLIILSILLVMILHLLRTQKIDNINNVENNITPIEQDTEYSNNSYDNSVYYEQDGMIYSTSGEPKDGIDFEIKDVPDEVFRFIKDKKAFYATMKTYAISYGFDQKADIAIYNRHEVNQNLNKLAIEFMLDDDDKTSFVAMVNLTDETIEIINK